MPQVDYDGRMAAVYDRGRHLPDHTVALWADAARRHLPSTGQPVLDLGAGTGRFLAPLSMALGVPVVGVEPAEGMRARAAARRLPKTVSLVAARAESLPLGAARFAGVWASQVLHHPAELGRCAHELRRVLAPGGRVLVRGMYDELALQWPLAPYFPEAVAAGRTRFARLPDITAALERAGMHLVAHEKVEQVVAETTDDFLARTALRADSALAVISDDAFAAGFERLRRAVDDGSRPAPVCEVMDLAVFSA